MVGYAYDEVGNRTAIVYPGGQTVTYGYDDLNRLETVTDWDGGLTEYGYDAAGKLTHVSQPNGVTSAYAYDDAGRLTLLSHSTLTQTLSSYAYALDRVGNRVQVTETLAVPLPGDTFLESGGLVAMEAEHLAKAITTTHQAWITGTAWAGHAGTAYVQAAPDLGALYATEEITASPELQYNVRFVTPGAYSLWLYGAAPDAAGDSVHVSLGGQVVGVSGFAPRQWTWANSRLTNGEAVTLTVAVPGLYTLHVWAREDGLRLDRILLTTDGNYVPTDQGPAESARSNEEGEDTWQPMTTVITYDYDPLYRLTSATYSSPSAGSGQSGQVYTYTYDQVGNRLTMGADGDVKEYAYDAANRLTSVDGVSYTWDDNGNLLDDGVRSYGYDYANRLVQVVSGTLTTTFTYNGDGHRLAKSENGETTIYAVAVLGLSQVLMETTDGESVIYLYGHDLLAEEDDEWKWHLGDGLGSVRQLVDVGGDISLAQGYTPFGVPLWSQGSGVTGYGFTGERWEAYSQLLFLRARYYEPGTGRFLSPDTLSPSFADPSTLNFYCYVRNNPVAYFDPSGYWPVCPGPCPCSSPPTGKFWSYLGKWAVSVYGNADYEQWEKDTWVQNGGTETIQWIGLVDHKTHSASVYSRWVRNIEGQGVAGRLKEGNSYVWLRCKKNNPMCSEVTESYATHGGMLPYQAVAINPCPSQGIDSFTGVSCRKDVKKGDTLCISNIPYNIVAHVKI